MALTVAFLNYRLATVLIENGYGPKWYALSLSLYSLFACSEGGVDVVAIFDGCSK